MAYTYPSSKEVEELYNSIMTDMENFVDIGLKYADNKIEYTVCEFVLIDIIIRVDKRRSYFKHFHGMDCNEAKIASLFAYWFANLRPITVTDERYSEEDGYNNFINEQYAAHFLLSAIRGMQRINLWDGHTGYKPSLVNNSYVKKLCYSLRYRNISIDSIIVLADSITTETLVIADVEELEKYKRLLKGGHITQKEFNDKKAQLFL